MRKEGLLKPFRKKKKRNTPLGDNFLDDKNYAL